MYGILDLTWKPSAEQTAPPIGKAPAIIRDDPYTHGIVVPGAWSTLGAEEYEAQLRRARLTGSTAAAADADFAVVNERGDYDPDTKIFTGSPTGVDLRIVVSLTAAQTKALPAVLSRQNGYWDLQLVGGGTILAGQAKVLDDVTRVAS